MRKLASSYTHQLQLAMLSLAAIAVLSMSGATVVGAAEQCPNTEDASCCSGQPAGWQNCHLSEKSCTTGINGSCNSNCTWTGCQPN